MVEYLDDGVARRRHSAHRRRHALRDGDGDARRARRDRLRIHGVLVILQRGRRRPRRRPLRRGRVLLPKLVQLLVHFLVFKARLQDERVREGVGQRSEPLLLLLLLLLLRVLLLLLLLYP